MKCGPLSRMFSQEKQGNKHIPKAPIRHSGSERSRGTAAQPPAGGATALGAVPPLPRDRPAVPRPAPPASKSFPSRVSPASFPSKPMAGRYPRPSGAPPQWRRVATMDAEVQQVGATAVPPRRRERAAGKEGGMGRPASRRRGRRSRTGVRPAGLGRDGAVGAVSPGPSRGEALSPVTRGRFPAGAAQLLLPGGALPARPGRGGRGAGAAGRGPRAPLLPGLRRAEDR